MARKQNAFRHLFVDIAKAFRGGAVAWISAGILGVIIAVGSYYYNRLRETVAEVEIGRTKMSDAEAWAEARRSVGSKALWAVPFQNRNDPTKYIAVWYGAESDGPDCTQDPCLEMLGATKVDLLVGNGGLFERGSTTVRAGPDFSIDPQDMPPAERQNWLARYGSVTDWNGDGVREIFSIASSTGTSPTQYVIVSLFDTRTRRRQQLQMTLSQTSQTPKFIGNPEPRLRTWLGQRFREYVDSDDLEGCSRKLNGELQCRRGVKSDQAAEDEKSFALVAQLVDAWITEQGGDFVSGRLRLQFRPGLVRGKTCFNDGRFEWINMFKGPLIVNDRTRDRSAVVYLQGDHHREIPSVIHGRAYVWLGLAADRDLLAIDIRRSTVERMKVAEWQNGIPDPDEPGKMLESQGMKDQQIDGLEVSEGRLVYSGEPLTLSVDGRPIDQAQEFRATNGCNIYS